VVGAEEMETSIERLATAASSRPPAGGQSAAVFTELFHASGNARVSRTLMSRSTKGFGSGESTGNWSAPFEVL
jgi:hypothetical protein